MKNSDLKKTMEGVHVFFQKFGKSDFPRQKKCLVGRKGFLLRYTL